MFVICFISQSMKRSKQGLFVFPPKKNPNMHKALFDWPIVLKYDVKAISRSSSRMKFLQPSFRLTNQKRGQSNRGFVLYLALAPSKCFTSRRGLAVLDYWGCFARKRGIPLFTDERCIWKERNFTSSGIKKKGIVMKTGIYAFKRDRRLLMNQQETLLILG